MYDDSEIEKEVMNDSKEERDGETERQRDKVKREERKSLSVNGLSV